MTMRAACAAAFGGTVLAAAGCGTSSAATPEFGEATAVSRATDVGTAPMFAVSPRGDEAVVWVSAPGGGTDGRLYVSVDGGAPSTVADPLGPIQAHGEAPPKLAYGPDGALNVAYVVGREVPDRRFPLSALRFVRSADGGRSWSEPVTVTDDSVFGSHNFHALHAAGDGTLYVSWLDGRGGRSAAFVARSTDGGRSWEPNVRVSAGEACPCCRTALATGPGGVLYLAWRQVLPGSVRDVVVARSSDRGATWSDPVRVHADDWVFDACPHAGPSLQVDAAGRVHVAWWTGKEGSAGVWYARSDDGARRFGAPVPLGVAQYSRPAHVQLALGEGGGGLVAATWDDGTRSTPAVVLRVSRDGGATFEPARTLSAEGRAAAFPVLGLTTKGVTVAWSEEDAARGTEAEHPHRDTARREARGRLEPVGAAQVMVRRGTIGAGASLEAGTAFRPVAVGDSAPEYAAVSLSGDSIRVGGGARGGVTLVNVWATWCESCREEFADLERISRDYASRGVRVVAVSVDRGSSDAVARFVRAQRTTFPVAHDREGRIQRLYAAVGVPATYLIGADGRIAWTLTGSLHTAPERVREELDRALSH